MAVYLDYNASGLVLPEVLDRMIEVYRLHGGNADSRTHSFGNDAKMVVADARKSLAGILNVDIDELFFTSGATESDNIAVLGMLEYARQSGRTHFITTAIEHKAVLEAMRHLETQGCTVSYVCPDSSGRVKARDVLGLVTEQTALVSVMQVNSETGILQPVEEIGEALKATQTYFHVDATQGFGKCNQALKSLPYDMLSISAHKLGGPQGIGGLVLKRREAQRPPVQPLFYGGQQEHGFRPGTTPVALVAGFAKAAEICEERSDENEKKCAAIKAALMSSIQGLHYQINGDPDHCVSNTLNISFEGVDAEAVFVGLKDEFALSNGSACTSSGHQPSYVLKAMGLDAQRIDEALRFSWSADTEADFSMLVQFIKSVT